MTNYNLKIIPNAVDSNRLQITVPKAQILASWGLPANALVAGSYCRISLNRRPDAVIRALPLLPEPWHAVLVGEQSDPNEVLYLKNLIAAMPGSIQARIHLLPEDSSSGNVLNAFDVVVSAPPSESFGLTLAESLWLGKPVVATRTGLAQLHPQYFYEVLVDDSPPNIATAIMAAKLGGCRPGAQSFVQTTYSQANFLDSWTTLLKATAGVPVAVPSSGQQALSYAAAMFKHLLTGMPQAADEEIARREAICQTCPLLVNDQCTSCGCMNNYSFMGITGLKAKRAMAGEHCPQKKW